MARKVATFTPGVAVGGFGGSPHSKRRHPPLAWEWGGLGGHPPFEEVTSTPGMAVGGFGGSPPIQRGDIHPWRGSGGLGVPPIRRGEIHPVRRSGGFGGSPPFEEATSIPGAGVGGSAATLIEVRLG